MHILFKSTLAGAALIAGAFNASAQDKGFDASPQASENIQMAELEDISETAVSLDGATIAVARLDGGRLIPTPYAEAEDWTFLDRRIDTQIVQLGASAHIKYIPELPMGSQQPENKIDEIRLTAANEGFEYVLMYGVGVDANWASFGGMKLSQTGLTVHPDCASWEQAKAKALLINSFTGEVLGAATADNIQYNIGQLADEVEDMIYALTPTSQHAMAVIERSETEAKTVMRTET